MPKIPQLKLQYARRYLATVKRSYVLSWEEHLVLLRIKATIKYSLFVFLLGALHLPQKIPVIPSQLILYFPLLILTNILLATFHQKENLNSFKAEFF